MNKLIASTFCDREGTFQGLKVAIESAMEQGAKSLFILSCDANEIPVEQLNDYFQHLDIPVFGGLFPQIISGTDNLERGHIVCGLSQALPLGTISLANGSPARWRETLESQCPWLANSKSVITLIDGLSQHIDPFFELLYDHIGPDKPVVGGGAGSLTLKQKPCLITNQGILTDAALVIGLPLGADIGIAHGWHQMAGPFLVTKSEGNTIHTLNYEPAFKVYRESIESGSDKRFADAEFFTVAKSFPFGLENLDQEILIRDPITEENGSLVCVGSIPEHAMVYIMQGDEETLLNAAQEVTKSFSSDPASGIGASTLIFDCISRGLYLGDQFKKELENICSTLPKDALLIGALTLGEIASSPWGPIQFLNKTIVLSALQEQ